MRKILDRLVAREELVSIARPPAYVDGAAAQTLFARVLMQLEDAHRNEPWAMGVTSLALSRVLGVPEAHLVRIAEHFVNAGRLLNRGGYYAAAGHKPAFTSAQQAFFEHLVPIDETQPFLPIPFAGAAAAVKAARVEGVRRAFDTTLAGGTLVKIGDDLYRGSQIAQIRVRVELFLRDRGRMTAAQFRDLLGTSRRYAVPLLEWFDAHAVTIRDGDYRTLRKSRDGSGAERS
ncbi:MAG: SelB C-terminal domain-containing protein [Candidatus Eremiobacteraeota bacterium]|nr:SelB C-terminal domain-containing protein [Candidatus Eremiobacteraeota bacterium]